MRLTVIVDCVDPDAQAEFWTTALGYTLAEKFDQYRVLTPPDGENGPVVAMQGVPEKAEGKNRLHLDLHPKDPDAHLLRLQRLGATLVGGRVEEYGIWWQVMADPEGNVFCLVSGAQGHEQGDASSA